MSGGTVSGYSALPGGVMAATSLPDQPDLLRNLVLANRILAHEGVMDAFGHVSVRHPDDPDRFIISRSLGPELVTEADLQMFALNGEQVGGDPRSPYSERFIHGAVYEARPEVQAVCHNHAPRSEEHTSELQSRQYLVCRLLLEKKKKKKKAIKTQKKKKQNNKKKN